MNMKRKKLIGRSVVKNLAKAVKTARAISHPDPIGIGLDKLSSIPTTKTHGAVRERTQRPKKIGRKIRWVKYDKSGRPISEKQTPGPYKNIRKTRKRTKSKKHR